MRFIVSAGLLLATALSLVAQEGREARPHPANPVDRSGGAGGGTGPAKVDRGPVTRIEGRENRVSNDSPRATPPVHTRLAESAGFAAFAARERCTTAPTPAYWQRHDLMEEIRRGARRGFVPAMAFPADVNEFSHFAQVNSGWRAYGFLVPPGGVLKVDLQHGKPAWFRLHWCDRWGDQRAGMRLKLGDPSASYTNVDPTTQAVYLLVDDPGFWSSEKDPYLLKVQRSWDPKAMRMDGATLVAGIWNTLDPKLAEFR